MLPRYEPLRARSIVMHGEHRDIGSADTLYRTLTVVDLPSYADAVACHADAD